MNESVNALMNYAIGQCGTDYRLYVIKPKAPVAVYVYEGWYEISADIWVARFTFDVDGAIVKAVRLLPDEDEEQ